MAKRKYVCVLHVMIKSVMKMFNFKLFLKITNKLYILANKTMIYLLTTAALLKSSIVTVPPDSESIKLTQY